MPILRHLALCVVLGSGLVTGAAQAAEELRLYNWGDYINPEVLTRFTAETGIKVSLDTYGSNEEMLAKLQAGAKGYDIVFPSVHMHDTMAAVNGAGLAAPQIGVNLQLVIFGSTAVNPRYPGRPLVPRTVLINPVITPLGTAEEDDWEGCLSVPGLRGVVPRWSRIRYTGLDEKGTPIDRTVDGFHARVVQHECDHLIGKLYPMRVRDFSRFGFTEVLFPEISAAEDD